MATDVNLGTPYGRNLIEQPAFDDVEAYLGLYSRVVTDLTPSVVIDLNGDVVWRGSA